MPINLQLHYLYLVIFRASNMNSVPHSEDNLFQEERVEVDLKNFNVENFEMCIKGEVAAKPIELNGYLKVSQNLEIKKPQYEHKQKSRARDIPSNQRIKKSMFQ